MEYEDEVSLTVITSKMKALSDCSVFKSQLAGSDGIVAAAHSLLSVQLLSGYY